MAVNKRLRYEILRRDNHTCRYCGASAPDVQLRIDHVTPVALGGSDNPSNLVTACEPCNNGKTSTTPDAPLVANVADDALRWSAAMEKAARDAWDAQAQVDEYRNHFKAEWERWKVGSGEAAEPVPLPADWKQSVSRFQTAGLPVWMWNEIVQAAMSNQKVTPENTFRYVCGIAWKKVTALQDQARKHLAEAPDGGAKEKKTYSFDKPELLFLHLFIVWSWAWERNGSWPITDNDHHYFATDVNDLLDRGMSAHHDLTEAAFLAGCDHAVDPSSYLPPEPLTEEQAERAAGVEAIWLAAWKRTSPGEGPTQHDKERFAAALEAAVRAGHDRDWLLNGADIAGGRMDIDLAYYLPKPD